MEIRALGENGFENAGLIHLICSETVDGEYEKLERAQRFAPVENRPKIVEFYEEKIIRRHFKAAKVLPEDIFKIYKVNEETMQDVQFALSSHEPLVKFV